MEQNKIVQCKLNIYDPNITKIGSSIYVCTKCSDKSCTILNLKFWLGIQDHLKHIGKAEYPNVKGI